MAGCGNCGCNCIIADQNGVAYAIGEDAAGNEAIIVPSPDTRCGMFEFVHGSTLCSASLYPFVAPRDGITIGTAVVVLSEIDDAPVTIVLRRNGMPIGTTTLTAGTRVAIWPGTDFPITLDQLDELETSVTAAGTTEPTVSVQLTVCVPV